MHKRLRKLCIRIGWLLGAGLFYIFLCTVAGRPLIPCLFHEVTGLYCPGCGVSRMCLALFRLDFQAAFLANPVILMLLPAGLIIALQMMVRYVKTGTHLPTRTQTVIIYFMISILLLFGLLRNLPGAAQLLPPP